MTGYTIEEGDMAPPISSYVIKNYKPVGKYSLGIDQAIMEDPDLLILDEPLSGLDKSGAEEMRLCLFLILRTKVERDTAFMPAPDPIVTASIRFWTG